LENIFDYIERRWNIGLFLVHIPVVVPAAAAVIRLPCHVGTARGRSVRLRQSQQPEKRKQQTQLMLSKWHGQNLIFLIESL